MKLNDQGIKNEGAWRGAGVALPKYDVAAMRAETWRAPTWVHFGAGNIFRGFLAVVAQRLLNEGLMGSGIVAAETFDYDIIDKIYLPHDALALVVGLKPDGGTEKEVVASIAKGVKADTADAGQWAALQKIFEQPSLQMASFTITEKGYALTDMAGQTLPVVRADIEGGPTGAHSAMGCVAALMLARFYAGAHPIALVSMDNCSHNGEKLKQGVLGIAEGWRESRLVPAAFVDYLGDEARVSFPWTMIDKITPRPADAIARQLEALGVEDVGALVTDKHTYIAPFVNAEIPEYLVVEDRFPNGRPPLEKAGVYMTSRATVNQVERMKVTTCLNPLHTALAVFGCLLGYESIAEEMRDAQLASLVNRLGYDEGLPVVTDPGILSPRDFIAEVIEKRLPNRFIPDTPQRIATDTSQKVAIRFGETIKAHMAREGGAAGLTCVPLALAGWLRYLLGVDDEGSPMPVSPDPMLGELQKALSGTRLGEAFDRAAASDLLKNRAIFGVDLVAAGLHDKVLTMFEQMAAAPHAVRDTLQKYLD